MFTNYLKKEFYKFIYKKYSNLILFAKELILLFLLKNGFIWFKKKHQFDYYVGKKNYEEKGFDQFIKRIESSIQFLFIECDFFKLFKRIF